MYLPYEDLGKEHVGIEKNVGVTDVRMNLRMISLSHFCHLHRRQRRQSERGLG